MAPISRPISHLDLAECAESSMGGGGHEAIDGGQENQIGGHETNRVDEVGTDFAVDSVGAEKGAAK